MGLQHRLEYRIDLVAVGARAPEFEHLLLDEGDGAAALPLGPALAGQQGVAGARLAVAVVVLGEGLPVDPVGAVEVLDGAEPGVAPGFDLFLLPDQEPPLLDIVPFDSAVIAVVSHLRLQTGLFLQANSVSELPNIYN